MSDKDVREGGEGTVPRLALRRFAGFGMEERNRIAGALRVASDVYLADAVNVSRERCNKCQDRPGLDGVGRTCKGCLGSGWVPSGEGNQRIARDFRRYAAECVGLLEEVENA